MNNEIISNSNILYSELQEDDTALICKFIICDFGVNGNSVMLNRKTINGWLDTLISQPVVAAIGVNDDGTCDFEGHNVSKISRVDKDGNIYQDTKFNTNAIGVFDSVSIETINNKEYIIGTAKLWKRYADFCALVKKRMSEGNIATSWEIAVDMSHFEIVGGKKVKVIDKGSFLGHALLNKNFQPAYQDSKMLEVASENQNNSDLIDALKRDLDAFEVSNKNNDKEDDILDKEKENIATEDVENSSDNTTTEGATATSALTERDLKKTLREAIADKLNIDKWEFYIVYNFPTDGEVWVQKWDSESELDIIQFTYTVENDVVTMSEPVETKLTVSVKQINNTVAELNTKIDTLNSSIVEASAKIQEANKQIAELTPFKEAADIAEQARIEAETAAKRESLKAYATKSGFISDNEFSSDETIKNCIENVDEAGIKAIIAERFVASLDVNQNTVETSQGSNECSIETEQAQVKTSLADTDDESGVDYKAVMSAFLKK